MRLLTPCLALGLLAAACGGGGGSTDAGLPDLRPGDVAGDTPSSDTPAATPEAACAHMCDCQCQAPATLQCPDTRAACITACMAEPGATQACLTCILAAACDPIRTLTACLPQCETASDGGTDVIDPTDLPLEDTAPPEDTALPDLGDDTGSSK